MYSRGSGRVGSSGFEHIFLAEKKNNEISGLHNWIYFDHAELNNIVDYLGYMKKIDLGEVIVKINNIIIAHSLKIVILFVEGSNYQISF